MLKRLGVATLLLAVSGLLVLGVLGTAHAKKPPKPPPEPPPTLIHYQLTWLGTLGGNDSWARDGNNFGEVVGYSTDSTETKRAFLWTSDAGMVDLNTIADVPANWRAYSASEINDSGQIVGSAVNDADDQRGYLYDPAADPDFMLLPTAGPGDHRAQAINEFGDIAGCRITSVDSGESSGIILYTWDGQQYTQQELLTLPPGWCGAAEINDAGQILTLYSGYRYTPGEVGWEHFEDYETRGMNQFGDFVGRLNVQVGKNKTITTAFRHTDEGGTEVLWEGGACLAETINSAGDACGTGGDSRGYLYYDNDVDSVVLNLDDLVIGDEEDVLKWIGTRKSGAWKIWPYDMNDRDGTGFGRICGLAIMRESVSNPVPIPREAFLLTPVPVEP